VNPEVSVGRYISFLCRQSQAFISKKLSSFNIGSGQCPILLALQSNDGIMQDKLSSILGMDKANVARAVTKLEKEGYLIRRPDCADKRIWRIYLTVKGREVLPSLITVIEEWNSILSEGLDPLERETLIRALKTMAVNVGLNS
jgi:DNA-binding MarR family transcriptional regulator